METYKSVKVAKKPEKIQNDKKCKEGERKGKEELMIYIDK